MRMWTVLVVIVAGLVPCLSMPMEGPRVIALQVRPEMLEGLKLLLVLEPYSPARKSPGRLFWPGEDGGEDTHGWLKEMTNGKVETEGFSSFPYTPPTVTTTSTVETTETIQTSALSGQKGKMLTGEPGEEQTTLEETVGENKAEVESSTKPDDNTIVDNTTTTASNTTSNTSTGITTRIKGPIPALIPGGGLDGVDSFLFTFPNVGCPQGYLPDPTGKCREQFNFKFTKSLISPAILSKSLVSSNNLTKYLMSPIDLNKSLAPVSNPRPNVQAMHNQQ